MSDLKQQTESCIPAIKRTTFFEIKKEQIPLLTSCEHQRLSATVVWEGMEWFDHWRFHSAWQLCDTCWV